LNRGFEGATMTTAVPATPSSAAEFRERVELIVLLGRSLHEVGQPANRLERYLTSAARRLGVGLQVLSMPTALLLTFEYNGTHDTLALRTPPGSVQLEKLDQLSAVARQLVRGELEAEQARARITSIMQAANRWGPLATLAAFIASAVAFSVFFDAGRFELAVAAVVGLAVGLVAIAMRGPARQTRLFELAAASSAAIVVGLIDTPLGGFVEWIPLASGLIILLPGIGLVDAVAELANGDLVSGAARMAGVGIIFLAIAFGGVIGAAVCDVLPGAKPLLEPKPLGPFALPPALLIVSLGSLVRFKAAPRDWWIMLLGSTVAFGCSRFGMHTVGHLAGPFCGAFALGLSGTLFQRFTKRPPELVTIPGIALLVPGSVGVRSFAALLNQHTTVGIDAAFEMFLVAIALVTGLLCSSVLLTDRREA
jgi:uncharacterized membrane protein YjjP (DUF1212 family)